MNKNEEWRLIKKIKGLNLEEKCFDVEELEQSDKHEEQIPRFRKILEDRGEEVFNVVGHQIVTNEGVYRITHKSEIQYGDED